MHHVSYLSLTRTEQIIREYCIPTYLQPAFCNFLFVYINYLQRLFINSAVAAYFYVCDKRQQSAINKQTNKVKPTYTTHILRARITRKPLKLCTIKGRICTCRTQVGRNLDLCDRGYKNQCTFRMYSECSISRETSCTRIMMSVLLTVVTHCVGNAREIYVRYF